VQGLCRQSLHDRVRRSIAAAPRFVQGTRSRVQVVSLRSRAGAMRRRLKQAAFVFVVIFAAAQLVRPERANPPTDARRTIQAHVGTASGLVAILDRSCRDCHSNATVWPWYTQVAPLSWLMARGVAEGRKAVNFSEWGAYPTNRQRALLNASCD